jgi:hypothetical protein
MATTDADVLRAMLTEVTGVEPADWGSSQVGFGSYHYVYASGREGDAMRIGFAQRARNLTIYAMFQPSNYDDLLARLGPHSTGRACIYIKRLSDVDATALRDLIRECWRESFERYPES